MVFNNKNCNKVTLISLIVIFLIIQIQTNTLVSKVPSNQPPITKTTKPVIGKNQCQVRLDGAQQVVSQLGAKLSKQIQIFTKLLNRKQEQLTYLEQRNKNLTQVNNILSQRQKSLSQKINQITNQTLQHLRVKGLRLGNRWLIQQQGTNSYEALVFRDLKALKANSDKRYAMWNGKYKDL